MNIINKELALILKEKGLNNVTNSSLCYYYDTDTITNFPNQWHVENYDESMFIAAPTEHQTLDWIFECNNAFHEKSEITYQVDWLQFWYTTLLEHKFSLIYEFIGRLEELFESSDCSIFIFPGYSENTFIVKGYTNRCNFKTNEYSTKQQAKHAAILKCFELLKENNE